MEVTLGGDRLGSGNKQKVQINDNFQMSSFNLEQDFKSSLAPGVLYPFLKLIGTNHGTFDIDLDSFIRTLPTRGPLFGSYKLQLDLFEVPMRLYQAILHNNAQKIGMKMNQVYLPKIKFETYDYKGQPLVKGSNLYNRQINESSLAKYMGLSGLGTSEAYSSGEPSTDTLIHRKVNAIPYLAYYDIFKNYYANKQEEKAYVITPGEPTEEPILSYLTHGGYYEYPGVETIIEEFEPYNGEEMEMNIENNWSLMFTIGITLPTNEEDTVEKALEYLTDRNLEIIGTVNTILVNTDDFNIYGSKLPVGERKYQFEFSPKNNYRQNLLNELTGREGATTATVTIKVIGNTNYYQADIKLEKFDLQNIDDMRMAILSKNNFGNEFIIGTGGDWKETSGSDGTGLPYSSLIKMVGTKATGEDNITYNAFELNGLCTKTYQSDLFNNWLDNEWIEGEEGIAALTSISTQDGKFTIDSFIFAEKLYDIYNRIATGGGSYEDWQDAVYGEGAVRKAETPMYIGGMAAEIMFEEVISNSETKIDGDFQALGSLGGKGTQVNQRGGRNIHVKLREPGYIIGIASITPRICYSQGNDWDLTELDTMDDLHKPGLDGIGFQDLIVERMAWWNTRIFENRGEIELTRDSAGKQTAWINYQTAIDKCFGDFAKQDGYSFMVLNRNYEMDEETMYGVKDITTYIDPRKFNYAFAYDELAAQNFWAQIHSKVIARRKMGAQQIPNL